MKNVVLGLFVSVLTFTGVAYAIEKIDLTDIKCMVNGKGAAKEDKSSEWKDGKVFFCCDNCKKGFESDKKKHAAKANHQLIATSQVVQGACPMSGGKIKDEHTVELKGVTVSFCCPNCKGAADKLSEDERFEKLFGEAAFEKAKYSKPEPTK